MPTRNGPERRTLLLIYVGLLVSLALTALSAKLPLGRTFHDLMTFGFSVVNAVLTVGILMEVRYARGIVRVFAGAGLVWLFLLFLMTFADYLTRSWRF